MADVQTHKLEDSFRKLTCASSPYTDTEAQRNSQKSPQPKKDTSMDDSAKSPGSKTDDSNGRTSVASVVSSKSTKSQPRTPEANPSTSTPDKKKVPMNKIQVGNTPSPNLKTVRSKIGSLHNASYKPGGGNVKIEHRKVDYSNTQSRIAAKNETYTPSGGDKKIPTQKLQWNAKSKIGSLDNATYVPGGGDKKIDTIKLDFREKAKPKVGSKDTPKSLSGRETPLEGEPVNGKPKKDKKIFNDKYYLQQVPPSAGSESDTQNSKEP